MYDIYYIICKSCIDNNSTNLILFIVMLIILVNLQYYNNVSVYIYFNLILKTISNHLVFV